MLVQSDGVAGLLCSMSPCRLLLHCKHLYMMFQPGQIAPSKIVVSHLEGPELHLPGRADLLLHTQGLLQERAGLPQDFSPLRHTAKGLAGLANLPNAAANQAKAFLIGCADPLQGAIDPLKDSADLLADLLEASFGSIRCGKRGCGHSFKAQTWRLVSKDGGACITPCRHKDMPEQVAPFISLLQ